MALLQVLLLSIVISLLLLQLMYTARGQLVLARELEQRVQADLLIHAVVSEALFVRLVNPGSLNRAGLTLVSSNGATGFRRSVPLKDFTVETTLYDLAGLLPLRLPEHPLWPRVLSALGVSEPNAEQLLEELVQMQDMDLEDARFGSEALFSSSGFAYPNAPIQTPNSLGSWVALDPKLLHEIKKVSHHYTLATVNLRSAPELIVSAALGEFGVRLFETSADVGSLGTTQTLDNYLEDTFGLWVNTSASNLWRLEVEVQTPELVRYAQYDFYVNPRDKIPVTFIGK